MSNIINLLILNNNKLKMNKFSTIFVILFIILILDESLAVKCYRCQVGRNVYRIDNTTTIPPSCSKFDESWDYVVDCQYSTMCLKKVHKLVLNGETLETVERDCASQKYRDQVFRQGSWREEHKIEEPYKEGCEESYTPETGSTTTYCHCRGKYCNSATKSQESSGLHTDAMAVIFVFNAMKYLNSGLAQY